MLLSLVALAFIAPVLAPPPATAPRQLCVHRYLDPRNGRWSQRDPAGDIDGPNRYAYAMNSPVVLSDPWGTTVRGMPPWMKQILDSSSLEKVQMVWKDVQCDDYDIRLQFTGEASWRDTESGPYSQTSVGVARNHLMSRLQTDDLTSLRNGHTDVVGGGSFKTKIWTGSMLTRSGLPDDVKMKVGSLISSYDTGGDVDEGIRKMVLSSSFRLRNTTAEHQKFLTAVVLHELTHAYRIHRGADYGENYPYAYQAGLLRELGILRLSGQ